METQEGIGQILCSIRTAHRTMPCAAVSGWKRSVLPYAGIVRFR